MIARRPVRWNAALSDELDQLLYVAPRGGVARELRDVDRLLYHRDMLDASVTLPEEVWRHWISWVRRRQSDKLDTVIVISGRKGMGKSTLGFRLARELDPRFTLDQVVYRAADVADLFLRLRKEQVIMYDEAALGLLSTDWASQEAKVLVHCATIIRPKRLTLILCLPRFKRLNGAFREDLVDLWMRINHRGNATVHPALEAERYTDYRGVGWFADREWNPVTWASLQGDPLWAEYERHRWTQSARYLSASADLIGTSNLEANRPLRGGPPIPRIRSPIAAIGASRRFACRLCNVTFDRRDALQRHYKTLGHRKREGGDVAPTTPPPAPGSEGPTTPTPGDTAVPSSPNS